MLSKKLTNEHEFDLFCETILQHVIGKRLSNTTDFDKYRMIATTQKAILTEKWMDTQKKYETQDLKKVYYLSLEFLMGRSLRNAVDNSDMQEVTKNALRKISVDLEDLYEQEYDAGLGNGGLGRLAACFLDSMATMDIPGCGFGIRYEYGMFNQDIVDGYQVEKPDNWLFKNNPWEIQRVEDSVQVKFYGMTRHSTDKHGKISVEWADTEKVIAIPYIVFIPGYKTDTVNSLILWSAKSSDDFNLDYFNNGDYEKAIQGKALDETITKVLYPNDNNSSGKELRLKQQYFFVSASLQTIIKEYLKNHKTFDEVHSVINKDKITGWIWIACFIGITGIPPSPLFISEFLMVKTMIASKQFLLMSVFLTLLTVIMFGIAKWVIHMSFGKNDSHNTNGESHTNRNHGEISLSLLMYIPQIVLLILSLISGLYMPGFLIKLFEQASSLI